MVMSCPPEFHIWKFLMKNMIPTNDGLRYILSGLCNSANTYAGIKAIS